MDEKFVLAQLQWAPVQVFLQDSAECQLFQQQLQRTVQVYLSPGQREVETWGSSGLCLQPQD